MALMLPWFLVTAHPTQANEYLYYRDLVIPPFKSLREFFDLPNRSGNYEVTLVSDAIGPLTFHMLRIQGEHERLELQNRSYQAEDHQFIAAFANPSGKDDLMVVIDNSNPLLSAKVSIYVVEPPPQ
ncbi:MAG: hypothetical protein Q9M26_00490 [Mariprofundales bacterium]|nr:hypothetical protein [Mariprofundales bacterium]